MIFKDKQNFSYNIFSGIKDIKHILPNHCFSLNNIDVMLGHVEGFLILNSTSRDLMDLPIHPTPPPH